MPQRPQISVRKRREKRLRDLVQMVKDLTENADAFEAGGLSAREIKAQTDGRFTTPAGMRNRASQLQVVINQLNALLGN